MLYHSKQKAHVWENHRSNTMAEENTYKHLKKHSIN